MPLRAFFVETSLRGFNNCTMHFKDLIHAKFQTKCPGFNLKTSPANDHVILNLILP
jgi:hypothetical protein